MLDLVVSEGTWAEEGGRFLSLKTRESISKLVALDVDVGRSGWQGGGGRNLSCAAGQPFLAPALQNKTAGN